MQATRGAALTQARSGGITGREDGVKHGVPEDDRGAAAPKATGVALAVLALAAVLVVGLDQWTKQLALTSLSNGSTVRLLGGAVYFDLTRNSGAAFSIGTDITFIFPLIAIAVLGIIIWFARQLRSWPWGLAMGLVLGGAMGNLVDRVFRAPGPLEGHVVDFISVFAPGGDAFPIFNTADSALFCGVVLAVALEFTGFRRDGSRVRPGTGTTEAGPAGEVRHSPGDEA
jgi:signal peptidase II